MLQTDNSQRDATLQHKRDHTIRSAKK